MYILEESIGVYIGRVHWCLVYFFCIFMLILDKNKSCMQMVQTLMNAASDLGLHCFSVWLCPIYGTLRHERGK